VENGKSMNVSEELKSHYRTVVPRLLNAARIDPKIRGRLSKYAWPFVPYVGDGYDTAATRIVIVGKATNGWGGENASLDDFRENVIPADFWRMSDDFVLKQVMPFYAGNPTADSYHSLFWQRIYLLVPTLLSHSQLTNDKSFDRAECCFRGLAWTNVFKIGNATGNPDCKMQEFLLQESLRGLLLRDLEILRPEIVLFSTHPSYDEFLSAMLPGVSIGPEPEPGISLVKIPGHTFCGFRTLHFQNRRFRPDVLLRSLRSGLAAA
jgi:hypothetical protein